MPDFCNARSVSSHIFNYHLDVSIFICFYFKKNHMLLQVKGVEQDVEEEDEEAALTGQVE